jgi:hypothetical protein
MSRSVRISWTMIDAWESWIVEVPDDAPKPLTPEWVNENFDKIEFVQMKDGGCSSMENPEIDYEYDD